MAASSLQDASSPATWRAIFEQAHYGKPGPFQVAFDGSLVTHTRDYVDFSKAGVAPDDFPLLTPEWPALLCFLYLAGTPLLQFICRRLGTTGKSTPFRVFCVVHNFLLFCYSLWAAAFILPLLFRSKFNTDDNGRGYWPTFCDEKGMLRHQIAAHVYLNYLSKAYEFVDTAVLIVKGKEVSLLQSYHHAGIIIAIWMVSVSRHPHGSYMVGFNALVHTVMYFYFMCTELPINRSLFSFVRPWITRLQLLQFLTAVSVAFAAFQGYFGYWEYRFPAGGPSDMASCINDAQAFGTVFSILYLLPLIALFLNFYIKNYFSKKNDGAKSSAKGKQD